MRVHHSAQDSLETVMDLVNQAYTIEIGNTGLAFKELDRLRSVEDLVRERYSQALRWSSRPMRAQWCTSSTNKSVAISGQGGNSRGPTGQANNGSGGAGGEGRQRVYRWELRTRVGQLQLRAGVVMRTVIVLQEEKKCLQHHIFPAITYISTNMAQWYITFITRAVVFYMIWPWSNRESGRVSGVRHPKNIFNGSGINDMQF